MADEKKDNDIYIPDLSDFLKERGLLKYKDALIEAGLEEDLESLKELDDDDIDYLIKTAKLKKFRGNVLKRSIKEYQDGTYIPAAAGQQKRLNVLREGRKYLRGVVPRKVDKFTGQKAKTIIFIGATGVGKTTCINSMCNYLEEISYDEQFRYKLICDDTKDQTKSQTRVITQYHLENLPALNYSAINIVDTPGFGNTEGPQRDKQIQNEFKQFFETKCPFVDGIYFVVKASDIRAGLVQKYIFNMVFDLFGEDIKENIFILFTFSDGSSPPALAAVQKLGIKYAKEFRINNSGFRLPNNAEHYVFHEAFFNGCTEQFKIMFDALQKVQTKSTEQTKQTLRERANITKGLEDIKELERQTQETIQKMKKSAERLKEIAFNPKAICDSEYFNILIKREIQNQETRWRKRVIQSQRMINGIGKMKKSVERLKEIALNPKAIDDSEYFYLLIKREIQYQETGWRKRVTQLQMMINDIGKIQSIIRSCKR